MATPKAIAASTLNVVWRFMVCLLNFGGSISRRPTLDHNRGHGSGTARLERLRA
jgi:hypothetical protein